MRCAKKLLFIIIVITFIMLRYYFYYVALLLLTVDMSRVMVMIICSNVFCTSVCHELDMHYLIMHRSCNFNFCL
jgi:hypothetical protein